MGYYLERLIENINLIVFFIAFLVPVFTFIRFHTLTGLERIIIGIFIFAAQDVFGVRSEFSIYLAYLFLLWGFYAIEKKLDLLRNERERDGLTGVYNRRFLDEALRSLSQRGKKLKAPVAVFMLDLDNFRKVNETFGHQRGDEVLSLMVDHLKGIVGKGDLLCRYGGDEFVILAQGMDRKRAQDFLERLKSLQVRVGQIVVGMSVGYALFPEEGRNFEDLLFLADGRMFEEKALRLQR